MNAKTVHALKLIGPKGSGLFEDLWFLKEKEKQKKSIFAEPCFAYVAFVTQPLKFLFTRKKDLRTERKFV